MLGFPSAHSTIPRGWTVPRDLPGHELKWRLITTRWGDPPSGCREPIGVEKDVWMQNNLGKFWKKIFLGKKFVLRFKVFWRFLIICPRHVLIKFDEYFFNWVVETTWIFWKLLILLRSFDLKRNDSTRFLGGTNLVVEFHPRCQVWP